MPTYSYKCNDCGIKFDKFFKSIVDNEEVTCPSCKSKSTKKIISASFIGSSDKGYSEPVAPSCPGGYCNFQ